MLKRLFITLTILGTIVPGMYCSAQEEQFRHYSSDEGFTGSAFKRIVQDSLGFLWISSNSLVFKFDGFTFTPYKVSDDVSKPTGSFNPVWVDTDGKLWLGGPNSISYFDRDLEKFTDYRLPIGGLVPEAARFDGKDNVWIGSEKGLILLDVSTGQHTVYWNSHPDAQNVALANTVRTIVDQGSSLLLGTDRGLWMVDKETKEFSRPLVSLADTALAYSDLVRRIIPLKEDYWIWMDQQLVHVDSKFAPSEALKFQTILEKFDPKKKFDKLIVVSVERDAGGIFWIATQGLGLVRYDPATSELVNYLNDPNVPNSLPSDVLHNVMIDRDQNVWITTVNKGIAQLKRRSINFHNYLPGVSTTGVAIVEGDNGSYLVTGSNGGGLWVTPIEARSADNLKFEKLDLGIIKGFESSIELSMGKERLWIGSLSSGVLGLRIDKQNGRIDRESALIFQHDANNANTISENFITSVVEDPHGHLFVGTYKNGMSEVNLSLEHGAPGSVYRYHLTKSNKLFEDHIPDIKVLDDQSLMAATTAGLFLVRPSTHQMELLTKEVQCNKLLLASDGTLYIAAKTGVMEGVKSPTGRYSFKPVPLPGSPFVTSLVEDRLGRLWCSSFEGLFFYDKKNQFVTVFKKEDGLPSSRTVNAAASVQTSEGVLILSNAEGITAFDPLSLRISSVLPKPKFTQLKINNRVVGPTDEDDEGRKSINTLRELTLNHTQNILTIEFSAMDFTAPEKNEYKFKLQGFDDNWVYADWKNRTATYTNLKPGNYTFVVVASNSDGVWGNHEATLVIKVLPPPWKTWWAYWIYGVIIASILFLVRRNIIKQERLASKLALEHVELEKVQEIDRAKTNFFANISHEFRTPLTLIQGPVQNLLERFNEDSPVKDQLNLVQQNSDRLLRLVNQILELARLESGSLKNETSESNIILFLKQIVGSFTSFATQKRISFVQQFPDYSIRAQFDKDKLEKIASNLVSNALKFTPEQGAVIVNVSIKKSNGSGELQLRVTDTGKGVPEDQMGKIFERFYQVSEDGNINVGTGIGLALCKELAEFLGGSLTVESTVGEGSKFTLTLPIAIVETITEPKPEIALIDVPKPRSNGVKKEEILDDRQEEKPILLIVEDHADLRKFIISCLGNEYQFLEASNGSEGLQTAIDEVPTLILSDVMMPVMDGIEMCHKIKNDHRTCHIPLILLTAKASNESKLSGLDIGADDYIIKPFNKEELKLKIRNQVLARARMQEKIRLEFLSESTTIKAVSADEKFLERLKKVIEARIGDEMLSVEALTEEMGMSRAQLYRKVTALTGFSGNEFIRKLRLHRAAQLLQLQTGPVSQIAYEVGFSNLSYFSKCFKEQFGVLPSEYAAKAHVNR